jgi:perosamine synthetase
MIRIAHPQVSKEARQAVLKVLESGQLAQGQTVRQLEVDFADFIGVRDAIAVNSGTAALMLAIAGHGIGPGDEVITTPFSFVATANAILYAGAKPVFVDVRLEDGLVDTDLVEAAVTPRTRAILPVHLYGRPCNMSALQSIAERHNLVLIEDAAQAHGATWNGQSAGSFGTGCFSLYATKNLSSGEGGIITTNDAELAHRIRLMRDHGQEGRYNHVALGFNFRLTEIAATLALYGLKELDASNAKRRQNAEYLSERLRGVETPVSQPGECHVFHQYTVRVAHDRDGLAVYLKERGIETAIHYPTSIPEQPYYKALSTWGEFPNADRLSREVLSLPVHPHLTDSDLNAIVEGVNSWTTSVDRELSD